uniref:Integrase_H2C2 domain-containing protein n=1 Tax=Heligmosomoides polygyrus TaxID=6339 RepID=A0A183GSG6_HELPZ
LYKIALLQVDSKKTCTLTIYVLLPDTKEEALQKAKTARTIFEEMGMNLREFFSNGNTLCANLPKEACAKSTTQKVLGVLWCAENDCMITRCPISHPEVLTKHIVARQIASVFDSLGWLVPLLTRAKIFQQDLWKLKFQWNVKLPQHPFTQWADVVDGCTNAETRSLSKEQAEHYFWWTGPPFLTQPVKYVKYWYNTFHSLAHEENGFDGCANVNAVNKQLIPPDNLIDYSRHSSLRSAKRVTALVLRFIKRLLRSTKGVTRQRIYSRIPELKEILDSPTILEGKEIRAARSVLIRYHQFMYLKTEYMKSTENTLRLNEDEHHVWRSRGRIGNSALDSDTISPIFIAPNIALARLIIQEAHGNCHRSIEHIMASVIEHYWIPKLRQKRANSSPTNIGLDFFNLPPCTENGEKAKLYGCTFTCAVPRLVHFEAVRRMATEEFLNALRRFSARRGGSSQEELSSIRPIDFVQSEMELTLALKPIVDEDNKGDPNYLPSDKARALQCREQVVQALLSSCQETEKFWNLWQQHYLTYERLTGRFHLVIV